MSLLLISSNVLIRERWKSILQSQHHILEAASFHEIRRVTATNRIDLLLFHRNMSDLDSIADLTKTPLMVFADLPDDQEAIALFRHGALGYANTYMADERLREAVQVTLAGHVWIGRALMQRIIHGATAKVFKERKADVPVIQVTDREWELAVLVSKGYSNLAIAKKLDITERTVKAHIGSIFKKTGTSSRLQLALLIRNRLAEQ